MTEADQREKLYSINQAVFATFLGGPLGGTVLLAQNYKHLNQPQYAKRAVTIGLLATLALFAIAMVLPEGIPNAALPVGYTAAFRLLAERLQGVQLKAGIAAGVERYSWWRTVGVTLATLSLSVLVLVGGLLLMESFSAS